MCYIIIRILDWRDNYLTSDRAELNTQKNLDPRYEHCLCKVDDLSSKNIVDLSSLLNSMHNNFDDDLGHYVLLSKN